jgi:hypothetical protein
MKRIYSSGSPTRAEVADVLARTPLRQAMSPAVMDLAARALPIRPGLG